MEGDVAVGAAEKDVVGEPVEFAAGDVVAGHVVGVGVVDVVADVVADVAAVLLLMLLLMLLLVLLLVMLLLLLLPLLSLLLLLLPHMKFMLLFLDGFPNKFTEVLHLFHNQLLHVVHIIDSLKVKSNLTVHSGSSCGSCHMAKYG